MSQFSVMWNPGFYAPLVAMCCADYFRLVTDRFKLCYSPSSGCVPLASFLEAADMQCNPVNLIHSPGHRKKTQEPLFTNDFYLVSDNAVSAKLSSRYHSTMMLIPFEITSRTPFHHPTFIRALAESKCYVWTMRNAILMNCDLAI